MGGWEWMCEWMSSWCHSCAQTLDRGERCLVPDFQCPRYRHHQAPRVRVTRNQDVGIFVEHIYKINVFCQYCPREGLRRGAVLRSICQASWPTPTTTLVRKRTSKRRHNVWWVEFFFFFFFFFFRSVHGCMGMDVWVNVLECYSCAQTGPWRKMSHQAVRSDRSTCNWGLKNKTKYKKPNPFYYLLKTSANVLCQYCPRRGGLRRWSSAEEHLPSFLTVAHHIIGQEEDN